MADARNAMMFDVNLVGRDSHQVNLAKLFDGYVFHFEVCVGSTLGADSFEFKLLELQIALRPELFKVLKLVLFLTTFANQETFERKVNRYKGVPISEVIQANFNKEALNGKVLLKNLFEAFLPWSSLIFVFGSKTKSVTGYSAI